MVRFKAWTFPQIIWHMFCAFVNIFSVINIIYVLDWKWNVIKSIFFTLLLWFEKKKTAVKALIHLRNLFWVCFINLYMWVLISMIQKRWFWFERQGTFGSTKKVRSAKLQALFDKNSAQTLEELAKALNVVNQSFLIITRNEKDLKRRQMDSIWIVWIGYLKSFNHLYSLFSRHKKKAVFVSNCNVMKNRPNPKLKSCE